MTNDRSAARIACSLALLAFCLLEFVLRHESKLFQSYEKSFLLSGSVTLPFVTSWCGWLLFLTFRRADLPLVGLLAIALMHCGLTAFQATGDAIMLFWGVALGKGINLILAPDAGAAHELKPARQRTSFFLYATITALSFTAFGHLDMSDSYYHGPRWMGLWDNPNTYGLLMGTGTVLAAGLAGGHRGPFRWWLGLAMLMMATGLVMSYSRGAWLATGAGLLYLARSHGRLKWQRVLPALVAGAALLALFWGKTPDTAPWYVKRADLARPSAQHRAAAWLSGLQIMQAHPLGVGWNNAVKIFENEYSPPDDGALALTTNDYLMLGTQLGIPAVLCFVAYLVMCHKPPAGAALSRCAPEEIESSSFPVHSSLLDLPAETARIACLSAAWVLIVGLWFDGGLFKLPTAAMFWVLLELGRKQRRA